MMGCCPALPGASLVAFLRSWRRAAILSDGRIQSQVAQCTGVAHRGNGLQTP